jgi:putative transposase
MQLNREDVKKLEALVRRGVQPVRTVRRALILQRLGEGESGLKVAAQVGVAVNTVYQVRKRYLEDGLERALYDRPRPGAKPVLDTRQKQRIIAMVCSSPPPGQARWTVRLITAEAQKRKLVQQVGREAIRILLLSHDLKPWREKNVVHCRVG